MAQPVLVTPAPFVTREGPGHDLPPELSHYEAQLPQPRHASRIDALLELADGDRPPQDVIHLVRHARSLALELADEARAALSELQLSQLLDGEPALDCARAAQARFDRLNDTPRETLSVLRQAELQMKQLVPALAASLVSAALAEEAGREELQAEAWRRAGELYSQLGDDQGAITAYEKALALNGHQEPQARDVPVLLALGGLYMRVRLLDAAFRTYRAAGHLTHLEGTIDHADSLGGLGTTYGFQGDHARALQFLDKAAQLAAQRTDHRRHTRYLNLMASAHAQLNEQAQATEAFQRSLTAAEASGKPDVYAITLLNLAEYNLNQARYDEASPLLDQALTLSHQAGLENAERRVQQMLVSLAIAQGEPGKALEHHRAWAALEQAAQARGHERLLQVREATWQAELQLALRRERRQVRESLEAALGEASARITELHLQADGWKDTSMFDPQSGARSRRYGIEQLTQNFKRSLRSKGHLSLAVVGIDMSAVEHGGAEQLHTETVLRTMTQVLERCVRDTDTVARFDDWKFMVTFPETAPPGAKIALLRVIEAVAEHDWKAQGLKSAPILSIGLAGRGFLQGAQLLLDAADEEQYRARREGHPRLCVAE